MDTKRNTAAIYVRRSAVDSANTEADAFSRSLAAQDQFCGDAEASHSVTLIGGLRCRPRPIRERVTNSDCEQDSDGRGCSGAGCRWLWWKR
jgi:hypothetical protein